MYRLLSLVFLKTLNKKAINFLRKRLSINPIQFFLDIQISNYLSTSRAVLPSANRFRVLFKILSKSSVEFTSAISIPNRRNRLGFYS